MVPEVAQSVQQVYLHDPEFDCRLDQKICFHQNAKTTTGTHAPPYSTDTGVLFGGVKLVTACLRGVDRDKSTLRQDL
jgi:hypothetical protein